jgi:hypothetical protein
MQCEVESHESFIGGLIWVNPKGIAALHSHWPECTAPKAPGCFTCLLITPLTPVDFSAYALLQETH